MIAGGDVPRSTCIREVWNKAWRFAENDERVSADVYRAQRLNPSQVTASDFLRQCAWAIFGARRRYEVLEKRWSAIERAFYYWNVRKVVEQSDSVRAQVLGVLNSPRKVDAVLEIAKWLTERTWPTIRAEFLSLVRVDQQGNPVATDDLLEWFDQLPWVGQTLAAYIAKDLGIGSIKDDLWMRRLAGWLGYSANTAGVWRMALDIQVLSEQKINVIDTVLWNWAKNQKRLAQT
jgi:hypothetical protein